MRLPTKSLFAILFCLLAADAVAQNPLWKTTKKSSVTYVTPANASWKLLANGPMVDATMYGSINAAVAAIGSTSTTLLVSRAQTLTASLTIPSTLSLVILKGGSIVKASSYTLTIKGKFDAGLYQVFFGFSTGDVTFDTSSVCEVYPDWWATNTTPGTTDMTGAVVSALATGRNVSFVPSALYAHTGSLNPNTIGQVLHGNHATLKRIGGASPSLIVGVADYMEVHDLKLDNSGLGVEALYTNAHNAVFENILIDSCGGTAYGMHIVAGNVSSFKRIKINYCYGGLLIDSVGAAYGCYYSTFEDCLFGNLTTNAINIGHALSLRFINTNVEQPIYLHNVVEDVQFLGLSAEVNGVRVMNVDGAIENAQVSDVAVRGCRVYPVGNMGTVSYFRLVKVKGFRLSDCRISEPVGSTADFITISDLRNSFFENIVVDNTGGNYHNLIKSNASSDGLQLSGLYLDYGNAIGDSLKLSNSTIRNSNIPQSFIATSSSIFVENVSGFVNTANVTGMVAVDCHNFLDAGNLALKLNADTLISPGVTILRGDVTAYANQHFVNYGWLSMNTGNSLAYITHLNYATGGNEGFSLGNNFRRTDAGTGVVNWASGYTAEVRTETKYDGAKIALGTSAAANLAPVDGFIMDQNHSVSLPYNGGTAQIGAGDSVQVAIPGLRTASGVAWVAYRTTGALAADTTASYDINTPDKLTLRGKYGWRVGWGVTVK